MAPPAWLVTQTEKSNTLYPFKSNSFVDKIKTFDESNQRLQRASVHRLAEHDVGSKEVKFYFFLLPTIRALVAALSVGPAVSHRAVEVGKPLPLAVSTRRTRKRYQDFRDKPQ